MKKCLIALLLVLACITTTALISIDSNAEKRSTGNKGYNPTTALSNCINPPYNANSNKYPSACAKSHGTYGGVSWRYYKLTDADKNSNRSISLSSLNGTGSNAVISGCNKVGGFYFFGYEVYDGKTGNPMGYNVPSVNHASLADNTVQAYRGTIKNNETTHGAGLGSSDRRHTFASIEYKTDAEAKAAFERAIAEDGQNWSGNWNDMNLSYFCSASEEDTQPKSSSYTGSTTATASGSSKTAGPTSSQVVGQILKINLASTTDNSSQTVAVTFSHKINISGNEKGKTVAWHTSTPDNSSGDQSGTLTLDNTSSGNSYTTNPITVNVTLANGESKETCSTLFFGTGDSSYAKQCVKITVGPGLSPEEESYVTTFDAESSVKASEDLCVTNVDELSDIIVVDEANCPGGGIVKSGTDITGRSLRIYFEQSGEKVDLHFDHTVTRTDDFPDCEIQNAITLLPVSQGLPLSGNAKSIMNAINDKNNWGAAARNFLSNIDSLGFNPEKFRPHDSKDYSADASVEITPTASLYCQVISYMPTRLVNEECSGTWEKHMKDGVGLAGDAAKYVWNNASAGESIFETIANYVGAFFQWVANNSQTILEYLFRLGKDGVKEVKGFISNFLEDESAGISYACTTLQQDLNYDLIPYTSISEDVAVFGEEVHVNIKDSGIKSVPEHDGTLTPTGPIEVQVVTFNVPETIVYNLQGMNDAQQAVQNNSRSADERNYAWTTENPCDYFTRISGDHLIDGCTVIAERKGNKRVQIIPDSGSYEKSNSFEFFGINNIGAIKVGGQLSTSDFVCVAAGVRDADSRAYLEHTGTYWAISGATCRKVAKKPSLSITGGSVYSGNEIKTAITHSDGGVVTGSWVEYGAIANGNILFQNRYGFASGRALLKGSAPGDSEYFNPLTITNNPGTGNPTVFGNSGVVRNVSASKGSLKTSVTRVYKEKAAETTPMSQDRLTLSATCDEAGKICYHYKTGNLDIASTGSAIGDTHIIYATGNIAIKNNLVYGDAEGNNVPQIVIIADGKITIDYDVSRVDAWLIALDGSVETCSNAALGLGSFAEEDCNTKLTINGPVITKGVNANYRTNGSSYAPGDDPSDPAEIFNLPASAYVWSYGMAAKNSDRFYQTYVTELAPRY